MFFKYLFIGKKKNITKKRYDCWLDEAWKEFLITYFF